MLNLIFRSFIQFIFNIFLALDQLLNTLLLGHCDETLSSRLGRSKDNERYFWVRWLRIAVDALFFFDTDGDKKHCEKSIMPLEQQNFREVIDYEIWNWNKKEVK
jgi:hypothetical protein